MSWHTSQPIDSVFGSLPCVLRRELGLSQYELRRVFREIGRIPVPSSPSEDYWSRLAGQPDLAGESHPGAGWVCEC